LFKRKTVSGSILNKFKLVAVNAKSGKKFKI